MKIPRCIFLSLLFATGVWAQEKTIDKAEFDSVYMINLRTFNFLMGNPSRHTATFDVGGPDSKYKLHQIRERMPDGSTRGIFNEHVEGKAPRITREVITIGSNIFGRDIGGKGGWTVRHIPVLEKKFVKPHKPDPEPQAVRHHELSTVFDVTSQEGQYRSLVSAVHKGQQVRIFSKTETVKGIERATGAKMETTANVKYWFSLGGVMLRSESESNGRVGDKEYYLRTTSEWEFDPSITITAPVSVPGGEESTLKPLPILIQSRTIHRKT